MCLLNHGNATRSLVLLLAHLVFCRVITCIRKMKISTVQCSCSLCVSVFINFNSKNFKHHLKAGQRWFVNQVNLILNITPFPHRMSQNAPKMRSNFGDWLSQLIRYSDWNSLHLKQSTLNPMMVLSWMWRHLYYVISPADPIFLNSFWRYSAILRVTNSKS